MRCGRLNSFSTAVAAAASGGATIAPSAIAAASGSPAKRQPRNATAAVVRTTANTASETTGITLRRSSWGEVSNAASSRAGATNSARARSGSMRISGANGRKAIPAPAMASSEGYGTRKRSAAAVSTTAANRRTKIHSKRIMTDFLWR